MFCCRPTCPSTRDGNIIYVIETGPRGPMGPIGPIGPTGPTGPAGPSGSGGIASFGGMYSLLQTTRELTTTAATLTLESTMPSSNVTYGTNTITVANDGDYEVTFGFTGDSSVATVITTSVVVNGSVIPSGVIGTTTLAGQTFGQTGTTIITLSDGDAVTLQASSAADTTISPQGGVVAYLTVKQLSS